MEESDLTFHVALGILSESGDYLSIMPTSVSSERAFSLALKLELTVKKTRSIRRPDTAKLRLNQSNFSQTLC